MKMLRRLLVACLAICLCAVFGAVLFRIFIAEHYPSESTRFVFTESLTRHYYETGEVKAYTQDIRFPYDNDDDGNFFAAALTVVPDAGHLQVTVRYNESTLPRVAAFYGLDAVPTPEEGLFRYELTVSYITDDPHGLYRSYRQSHLSESDAFMYRYGRVAFDGVEFEGAVWMRVDIYYGDSDKCFGSIAVFETQADNGSGVIVKMPLKDYKIDEEDYPQ